MKASVRSEELTGPMLVNCASTCGWALARAHAKSVPAARLSGHLGTGDRLGVSLDRFAHACADQCESDYDAFIAAIRGPSFGRDRARGMMAAM